MLLIKDFILAIFVTYFICTIIESNGEVTEEEYNCSQEVFILNGSESGNENFQLKVEENCTVYTYQIKSVNKSSIIKIKSTFTDYSNTTRSNLTSQIQVVLKENTAFSNGTKSLIDVKKWIIDSQNRTSTTDQIFFSQTADLTVIVTVNGNWPEIELNFLYEEIEFEEYRNGSSDRKGIISPWVSMEGRRYRPNSAYVFQIKKPEGLNTSSIHLVLNKLHIDEGIGEYLLVGAGIDLFQGPPPLFISSLLSKKEIKINDENAYIVFVATSTRSLYNGFEITWEYNGTIITGKEDVTPDPAIYDESDSMPICIYNISAALSELNKSEDSFGKFRERLASLGNEYAKKSGRNLKIDSSQVRIIRVSAVLEKNDTVYVMVKIQHTEDGRPSFDWKQMGHILSEYSSRYHSEVDNGYWIKKCPKETRRKNESRIIFYAVIPVLFCLLCVLIWNWKQTPFSRMFAKKVKKAIIGSRRIQVVQQDEGHYVSNYVASTVPKVRITNDEGRRYTWDHDDDVFSSGAEQDSDVEVFNRTHLQRSNSSRSNPGETGSARSSTRSQKRPEINMAFEEDEEYRVDGQSSPGTSTPATNTLNSQKSLLGTFITDETKL